MNSHQIQIGATKTAEKLQKLGIGVEGVPLKYLRWR